MAALLEVRNTQAGEPDGRDEQELDGALDDRGLEADCRAAWGTAAVDDQDVEAAEGFERLVHEALQVAQVRQVSAHGEGAEPVGLALEHVATAGEHSHVCALRDQRLRDREPHPR